MLSLPFIISRMEANNAAADAPTVNMGIQHISVSRFRQIRSAIRDRVHMILESVSNIFAIFPSPPLHIPLLYPYGIVCLFHKCGGPSVSMKISGAASNRPPHLNSNYRRDLFEIRIAKIHIAGPIIEGQIVDPFPDMISDTSNMERLIGCRTAFRQD